MANSKIYVDYENLDSCISRLETLKDEYRTLYTNNLYGNVLESVKSAYAGEDCDAFVGKVEAFRNDFDRLSEVIQQYIDFLKDAKKDYKTIQDNLKNSAAQLSGDMR